MSESIVVWLKSTELAHLMIEQRWLWPICETLHFIGLALLLGTAGLFDLRLMGFLRGVPVTAAMRMRPWAAAGIVINLITGTLFIVAAPDQYIDNPAFYGKLLFLLVAMLNIAMFETRHGKAMLTLPDDAPTPMSFKIAGAVSITSWLAVLYFGRMLPFIGKAF